MEKKHPYISATNSINQIINRLRTQLPREVTSKTVKQLGIAPNNESFVINALQFIGIIDAKGKVYEEKRQVFSNHEDEAFEVAFSEMIKNAYHKLFDVHGDAAWKLDNLDLIQFFRTTDQTSLLVGQRQANVFKVFSALSGKRDKPAKRTTSSASRPATKIQKAKKENSKQQNLDPKNPDSSKPNTITSNLGMSIKIDVNIPSGASREDYDNIYSEAFVSI